MKKIQMVDLHSQYLDIKPQIDTAIQSVIDTTSFINGSLVKEFAEDLGQWNGTRYVIPCANGTDGLQIAMMALGLKPGDEVIVPAFTYIATVEVIALLGLTPIYVDVDYNTFNLDLEKFDRAITDKTKAVVPVHLYGQCADIEEITRIAKKHNVFVIEDLAQALGAKIGGIKSGNFGDIGVTSFFPSKNLGCYGDGGAILTNDSKLAETVRMICNHGQRKKYYHEVIGVNSRLDTLQAAILKAKLKELNSYEARRNEVAKKYDAALSDNTLIDIPKRFEKSTHVFHQYTLKVKNGKRDELKDYLSTHNIPSMVYYPLPIPEQNAYHTDRKFQYEIAKKLSLEVISLPIHTHMNNDQISYICETIKAFR